MPGMIPMELIPVAMSTEEYLWCPNCSLPSAAAVEGYIGIEGTFTIVDVFRLVECRECGADLSADHPGGSHDSI